MINFIKDAVTAVSGIKTFLFNTDYRNNFDLQDVEFPCCVLTPIMSKKYDLNNIIRESAELQLSVVDLAPYEYTGDELYEINKRCSNLALQVIANLQVKSKLDKELTFEFILPSGDELISGVMCNLQCTMKQGSCIGAPSYIEIVVQPIKKESITSNGKHVITPSSEFNAMREVEVDVNVDLKGSLQDKSVTITENGTQTITADEGFEVLSSIEVVSDVWEGFSDDDPDINAQLKELNEIVVQMIADAKSGKASGLNNFRGYDYNPPFILKRRNLDTSKLGAVMDSPFFYSNILNIDLDILFSPTKFIGKSCQNLFKDLSVRINRKINLGTSHDFTDITSASSMFNNSYLKELVWGSFVNAKNITDFSYMFMNQIQMTEIDMSPIYTRNGTTFSYFCGYGGGYTSPQVNVVKGLDWYNATNLNNVIYNLVCDLYADNWRLCDLNLPAATMHGDAVAYIIEHACGEVEGAVTRILKLNADTKKNFKALENYEELVVLAREKLITIT